jgi:hypothetical protein
VLGLTIKCASHVRKCPRSNEETPQSRGYGSSPSVSGTSMYGERSTLAMLMDQTLRCPCSWYFIQIHNRVVHALDEFMLEPWATKGRDLWLEVRRIRSGASRERYGDAVWLDSMASHRHLVVDVTVTSALTKIRVLQIGARLPLPSKSNSTRTSGLPLCLARPRFSPSMTTTLSHWRMGADWRLWRLSWLIVWKLRWQFVASLAWVQWTLVHCVQTVLIACNISFVDSLMLPFDDYLGMHVWREFMQSFYVTLHGTVGSCLRDA